MINEIKLREDGTICLVQPKEEIKGEIEIEEIPLVENKTSVIYELLPLEVKFDEEVTIASIFKMIIKYPALKQLHKSICVMTDLYMAEMWKNMKKEFVNKSPFRYVLFQKVVSNSIVKLKKGRAETFFITEPLMFGILKDESPIRLNPNKIMKCLSVPAKIHSHLTTKNLPPYEDGFNLLELIISAFKLDGFMNDSLNPF